MFGNRANTQILYINKNKGNKINQLYKQDNSACRGKEADGREKRERKKQP